MTSIFDPVNCLILKNINMNTNECVFFQIFNPLWAEAAAQGQSFVQVFNANGQKFRNMGDSHTHIYITQCSKN